MIFLMLNRGKVLFKLKEYKKAINDLSLFKIENLDDHYGNHFEELFY